MSRLNILITLALLIKIASYAQSQQPAYQVKASSSSESILFYNGLTELGVAEKAGYYNLLVDSALKGKSVDDAVLALKAAILCDKYDLLASEGKSVRLRYHARNTARVSSVCPKVIDAGLEAYGQNDYQRALDCFTLYLERYNTSLFVGKNKDRDPYFNSCAFFAVQAAYKSNHANIVDRYMDRALRSADYAEDATLIRLAMLRDNRQNWQDSLHYATVLSDAHHKYPRNNAIFGMMVDHYSDPARSSEFRRMMEGEVFIDKGNPLGFMDPVISFRMNGKIHIRVSQRLIQPLLAFLLFFLYALKQIFIRRRIHFENICFNMIRIQINTGQLSAVIGCFRIVCIKQLSA